MQDIVISVHIPKTGGTSFREILGDTFGQAVFEDYDWLERPAVLSGTTLDDADEGDIRAALKGVRCIHGHFPAAKYDRLRRIDGIRPIFITWLRDPVERAISAYYFLRQNPSDLPIEQMRPWERDAKTMSIGEFLTSTKFGVNRQTAQLRKVAIEDFDFVGCTEDYDTSITIFSHLFRAGKPPRTVPVKRKNPDRKGARYEIAPDIRKSLLAANAHDLLLHRYAQGWVAGARRMLGPL
ncbi:MAG: sulfotransferase family 2 domain-containing protein [Paracoccus sp. (in: a-proteobacteria)]|nr:sulfotransferase family 2 domain-containing protein [Paracoccus sp. (in: a-proteobacteria)]